MWYFIKLSEEPSVYRGPKSKRVETDEREIAIWLFAEEHMLSVQSADGDVVTFVTEDGCLKQYSVSDRDEFFPA